MEYINRPEVETMTGELKGYGLTPDEKETLDEAYALLTKLTILGNELHNEKLVVACDNLQNIIDEL